MFKKLILVIILAAIAVIVAFYANNAPSNDKHAANGGDFKNNRYTNNRAGFSADLNGWIYFDKMNPANLSEAGLSIDGSAFESMNAAYLMYAIKPGIVVMISYDEEPYAKDTLNDNTMKAAADYYYESLNDDGEHTEILEYGKLYGTDATYYFSLRTTAGHRKSYDVLCAYMNTPNGSIDIICAAEKSGNIETAKDFIRHNITLTGDVSAVSV